MRRYGSDKPDLRFGLELVDVTDILRPTDVWNKNWFPGEAGEAGAAKDDGGGCPLLAGRPLAFALKVPNLKDGSTTKKIQALLGKIHKLTQNETFVYATRIRDATEARRDSS